MRAATETALDRLVASDTRVLFAFCDGEPLREDLVAAGATGRPDRWPNLEFVDLPGRDHVLRPLWMHEHVYAAVDRAIVSELDRTRSAPTPAPAPTPTPAGLVRQSRTPVLPP
jgi:hypothetical protein